jgi:hypothetical protein
MSMRSHLPGQSDITGPSVVCVSGHAKKLVRLGDTKSGIMKLWSPPPSREMESMYVCACGCVFLPVLCARTHDRQRVPRPHKCHAYAHACSRIPLAPLGACIRTRMRARQTHSKERGGQRSRHTLDAPPVPGHALACSTRYTHMYI